MRKSIDRAVVRKKIREILALRRWSDKRMDGSTIPGEAFGIGARCDAPVWQSPVMKSKDYLFDIRMDSETGCLELTIDTYNAQHGPFHAGQDFDATTWDEQKIHLIDRPSRIGFRNLSRAARALLSGRNVQLPDGTLLQGIQRPRA